MWAHLSIPANAGLVTGERQTRSIIYRADLDRFPEMMVYLIKDCRGGNPDLCRPPIADMIPCCPPKEVTSPQLITFQPGRSIMPDRIYSVLFLCTDNSARSIIAEAILNRLGQGKFKAFSAGSHPRGEVHPYTIQLLKGLNHDTSFARSKNWEEFALPGAPQMDFVFTVCDDVAAEACPVWPGQPMMAHWSVADPAAAEGNDAERHFAFAETYRMLNNRISIFTSLPMISLDKLALQKRLDEIGDDMPRAR
jgi:protein-tyrosine-phosphatase